MRKIELKTIDIAIAGATAPYKTQKLLDEFVWGLPIWSSDENFRTTYKRCSKILSDQKLDSALISDQDHERLSSVLRSIDFTQTNTHSLFRRPLRQAVNDLLDSEVVEEKLNGAKAEGEAKEEKKPATALETAAKRSKNLT